MSKYMRNNVKLFAIVSIMTGVLVFSPALSTYALAENAEVAGVNATTEATTTTTEAATTTKAAEETATTAEATSTTESTATSDVAEATAAVETTAATEAATATEMIATTETTTSTEAAASSTATDDDGAAIVRFYDPEIGYNVRIDLVVGAYGTQYNGNLYIPATISDDHKSFTFDGNIQRDGYTLVGYSSETLSYEQRDNATSDQSMPYTVDANGFVHVNFADITTWSVTDDLGDDTITHYYYFAPLWAPNPEPEPAPAPEPASEPQPAPTPVAPASDTTQQPAVPRREKSVLPNTGDVSSVAGIIAALGVALTASGLRKKMK